MGLTIVKESEKFEENWENGLTDKQNRAALLIGYGTPKKDTAQKVGVSPQTISTWGGLPEFETAIENHRKDMFNSLRNELRGVLCDSVRCMRETLKNSTDEKIKVNISKFMIEKANLMPDTLGLY